MQRHTLNHMRRTYEQAMEHIDDRIWPSPDLLERRFEQIETDAMVAEPLSDVVPVEYAEDDQIGAVLDAS
eukprot:6479548-Amphidinium_carterae.1